MIRMNRFRKYYIAWTAIFVITIALIATPHKMHPAGIVFFTLVLGGSALTLLILGKKK